MESHKRHIHVRFGKANKISALVNKLVTLMLTIV